MRTTRGDIDEVVQMQRNTSDYFYHHDDQYNVTAITDANGAVAERYDYGDFGEPIVYDASYTVRAASAVGNPYLFTGRRYDQESGWYYYRTRYMDPEAGRFTTRDTIGIWGDVGNFGNAFAYVGNNPWTFADPFGLAKCCLDKFSKSIDRWQGPKKEQKFVEFKFKVKANSSEQDCCLVNFVKGYYKQISTGKFFTVRVFGRRMQALFPNWAVDTVDQDPVYWSRGGVRWNYFPAGANTWLATDEPGPVLKDEKMSFDFKMYIFSCDDVPINEQGVNALGGARALMGKAIECKSWSAKVTYNANGVVTHP